MALRYKTADGSTVPNEGEAVISHLEPDDTVYKFVVQHALVHCIILSVRKLVTRDCVVTFYKCGGHLEYPSGKQMQFVVADKCFSLPSKCCHRARRTYPAMWSTLIGFSRHG